MDTITLKAYAKINLSLEVTGKRPDGYHDIMSLMQGIGLHDVISVTKCPQKETKTDLPHCTIGGVVVYLCTDANTIPADSSNLAFRGIGAVLDALREEGRIISEEPGFGHLRVDIDKRLPVAAGIAGGSGNAAACMLGLNALAGFPLSLRDLMKVGTGVGADVPFSLFMNAYRNFEVLAGLEGLQEARAAAWTGGIGDIVEPAEPLVMSVILANPGIAVSTAAAYTAIDDIKSAESGRSDAGARRLYVNDLELYTLENYPEAARLRSVMKEDLSADMVLMSGSGPTMVAYYSDQYKAEADYDRMKGICGRERGWKVWLTRTGE